MNAPDGNNTRETEECLAANNYILESLDVNQVPINSRKYFACYIKWCFLELFVQSQLGADVRRACYTFMTELLQEYRDFLLPVTSKNRELLFDSEGQLSGYGFEGLSAAPFECKLIDFIAGKTTGGGWLSLAGRRVLTSVESPC